MQRANSHPVPQPRYNQQVVECRGKIVMVLKPAKTSPAVVGKSSLPPILKAEIALLLILTDFAVDLSIRRFLLVRILFYQNRPELRVGV